MIFRDIFRLLQTVHVPSEKKTAIFSSRAERGQSMIYVLYVSTIQISSLSSNFLKCVLQMQSFISFCIAQTMRYYKSWSYLLVKVTYTESQIAVKHIIRRDAVHVISFWGDIFS